MSIPSKQIGWSNKSNLLYEVLKQLNKLNKQICCGVTTSTTSSTTTSSPLPVVPCDVPVTYTGGETYPTAQLVTLGTSTGSVTYNFDAFTLPDRFIATWNNTIVIDTGYRGGNAYDFGGASRLDFTTSLTGKIDPILLTTYPDFVNFPDDGYPRVTSPGSGTNSFVKSSALPTSVKVDVYGPISGTAWQFVMGCPS